MTPSPTATTTRRGSVAGAGLASSVTASGDMSPRGGGVAGDRRVCRRAAARCCPGALVGMKPPRFAVCMFGQLGARAGDELVDVYPGSGAVWRRYTGNRGVTGDVADVDARRVASSCGRSSAARPYDLAVAGREQALTCAVTGARSESIACVDVGGTAEDALPSQERVA